MEKIPVEYLLKSYSVRGKILGNPRSQNTGLSKAPTCNGYRSSKLVLSGVGGDRWNQDLASAGVSCLHSLFSALLALACFKIAPLRHSSLRECPERIYRFFIVLQDHTPKMCFPSLPIGPFMKMVARIMPVFFSVGLFFSCRGSQLEKTASCGSQNICVSRRECGRDCKQRLRGRGGRRVDLFVRFVSTHLSLTLFSWSSIAEPCTHGVCIAKTVLSCNHTLPYPVIWYPEPVHLISSRPA